MSESNDQPAGQPADPIDPVDPAQERAAVPAEAPTGAEVGGPPLAAPPEGDGSEPSAGHDLPLLLRVAPATRAAARRWRAREGARLGRRRARSAAPLPKLFELYPEARLAPRRELGLQEIAVAEIRGTAVAGPDQRGADFLPLPAFRSANWRGRWQRIRRAVAEMAVLPPIEALKAAGGYWVVDGHNRVAAALDSGQLAVDAVVTVVRLPGDEVEAPGGSLASVMSEAGDLRAAATGRLSRGSSLEGRAEPPRGRGAGDPAPGGNPAAPERVEAGTGEPGPPATGPAAGDPV